MNVALNASLPVEAAAGEERRPRPRAAFSGHVVLNASLSVEAAATEERSRRAVFMSRLISRIKSRAETNQLNKKWRRDVGSRMLERYV